MASVRDIQFFNTLFKASEIFYQDPSKSWAPVEWNGRSYYVYKKLALKLFRILMPQFRLPIFEEDNALIKYIYEKRQSDRILVRLTYVSPERVITEAAHNDFEKLADLPPEQQEKGFNEWLEKHIGEKESKPVGGGKPPVIVSEQSEAKQSTSAPYRNDEEEEKEEKQESIQIPQQVIEQATKETKPTLSEPPIEVPTRPPTFRPPAIPEGVKTTASQAQIGARNIGGRAASAAGNLAKGVGSGLLRGGGGLAAKAGNFALQAGIRGVAALAAGGLAGIGATVGGAIALAVVIVIAVLVFVPMFQQELKDESLLMTGVAQAAPVGPPGTTPIGVAASCPVPNGKISCGSSKGIPGVVTPCHCTDSYSPACLALSRRGKAIDITSPSGSKDGDPVFMPTIKGQALKWYFKGDFNDDQGATLRVFQSQPTSDGIWTIHFVHSKRSTTPSFPFQAEPKFNSGQEITNLTQPVAFMDKSSGGGVKIHTHVSIGLIGSDWSSGNLQYNHSGWKYADADMHMCTGEATSPPPAPKPIPGGKTVVLDPGHGNPDRDGAQGKTPEGTLNLIVANRLKAALEAEGYAVTLTHNETITDKSDSITPVNHYENLAERIRRINASNASILVSIHFDASTIYKGPRAFYNSSRKDTSTVINFSAKNKKLAEDVASSIKEVTGFNSGSNIADDFSPGVYVDQNNRNNITPCADSGPYNILGEAGVMSCPNHEDSRIQVASQMPGIIEEFLLPINRSNTQQPYFDTAADDDLVNKIVEGYKQGVKKYFREP